MTRARNISKILSAQETTGNVNLSGVLTATSFSGEGSGLTGLAAVGSGVTILRDGSTIGAATKINFDNTFTVTDISSGISTITGASSGVTTADVSTSSLVVAGISTLAGATLSGVSTFNNSVTVDGTTLISGTNKLNFNTNIGQEGQLWANSDYFYISGNTTYGTVIQANSIDIRSASGGESYFTASINNGALLYHDNVKKFETTGAGVTITGVCSATSFSGDGLVVSGISTLAGATFSGVTTFTDTITADNITLDLGSATSNLYIGQSGARIEMSHNTSNGNITCTTGYQYIRGASGFRVQKEGGGYDDIIKADSDGAVELYYDDVKKIETATDGVYVAGIVTASTHVDSGITTYYGDSSYSAALRWTLAASGTDHYVFTGPGLGHSTANDPTLYLKRGQTYMFENKMGAHPFRIQSTTNGSTGTQWNVGVTNNDVSNGVLIFEVPFETPDTLYYQCTSHANMGGVINIS